jgi:hypothetical protein
MTISAMASPLVAGALPVNLRQVADDAGMAFPASMKDLLSRRPFPKTVRLQVVNVEPAPSFTGARTITATFTTQLLRMRQLYATANIGVELVGRNEWSDDTAALLTDLDVGIGRTAPPPAPQPCDNTLTAAQIQLYAHRDGMAANDVAIYRVRSAVPGQNGCASHPAGEPGAAVADYATQWTLAHEVGHVLGLVHADTSTSCQLTRLMTSCGTGLIVGVPVLVQSEKDTMNGSSLLVQTAE